MFQPQFRWTPRMQRQLVAIERTQGFLEALQFRPEWLSRLRNDVRINDALASIQIEGGQLTLETAFDLTRQRSSGMLRGLTSDEREFVNYLSAFDAIDALRGVKEYSLSSRDVRQLHNILLDGVRGGDHFKGEFRREDVVVGDREDGEIFVHHQPPVWSRVEDELNSLFEWMNACAVHPTYEESDRGAPDFSLHPVVAAVIAQHRLVWIHPFRDGNGRTARMFTALALYLRDYDFKYLFDLSSYYNKDRDRYYAALRQADASGDYTKWIEYAMGGLAMQMYGIRQQAREAAVAEAAETGA